MPMCRPVCKGTEDFHFRSPRQTWPSIKIFEFRLSIKNILLFLFSDFRNNDTFFHTNKSIKCWDVWSLGFVFLWRSEWFQVLTSPVSGTSRIASRERFQPHHFCENKRLLLPPAEHILRITFVLGSFFCRNNCIQIKCIKPLLLSEPDMNIPMWMNEWFSFKAWISTFRDVFHLISHLCL